MHLGIQKHHMATNLPEGQAPNALRPWMKSSGYLSPAFSGAQRRAEMVRHTSILGDPQIKGGGIKSAYLTRAFLGAQKRAELLCHPFILRDPKTKGGKIRSGYLTRAFSGPQKRAELQRHPCILGSPQTRGQNQKCLHRGQGQNYGYAAQKNITKNFAQMACMHRKTPLQNPHGPFKTGGAFRNPSWHHISENLPPPDITPAPLGVPIASNRGTE